MLTQVEWSKLNPTPLQSGVVEVFAQTSPILALCPFQSIAGSAYAYNREESLPGVEFRTWNEAYSESTGVVSPHTEVLTMLGGDSDYDTAAIAMQTGDNATRAIYDTLKSKALAQKWTRTFFGGDATANPKEFDGLERRLIGDQIISAGANGGALTFAMLDELVDAVAGTPSAIFMRKGTMRAYRSLLRTTGGITPEQIMIPEFGKPVLAHNGVPLLALEEDAAGNQVLSGEETQGTNNDTCSAYAIRFGPDALHGIQTAPVSVRDLGEIDEKPALRTRIEWFSAIVLKNGRCAARLKGLTNI